MAYTAGFSVNVGDPTKASDVTTLAANDDFLKAAVDAIMADSATPSSTLKATVVLADGVTATTQSAGNNTTRVATTAFVKTAVDASSTDPAGSNTEIQYNNSGAFGASANLTFDGSTLAVTGALSATGNISFDGGSFVFNESGADKDFRIEGDSNANLFFADASTDRIGIGTATPAAPLEVVVTPGNGVRLTDPSGSANASEVLLNYYGSTDGGTRLGYVGFGGTANSIMSIVNDQSDAMTFGTAATERLRIDASGNLGVGTTSPESTLTVDGDLAIFRASTSSDRRFFVDESSGQASFNTDSGSIAPDGHVHIHSASAGSVTAHTNANDLVIEGGDYVGMSFLATNNANTLIAFGDEDDNDNGYIQYANDNNRMEFGVNGSERMRIDSTGSVKVTTSLSGGHTFNVNNSNASNPSGMQIYFAGTSSGDTADYFYLAADSGDTRAINYSNGNWVNANNSYGSTSDVRLKQDIVDAPGYWNDFKALRYRKFRLKSEVAQDANAGTKIGLIAQEIEGSFSKLVDESPDREMQINPVVDDEGNATYKLDDDGEPVLDSEGNQIPETTEEWVKLDTTTKSIKYSVLHGPVMATVVQELQTRLEAAEAKIAALETA